MLAGPVMVFPARVTPPLFAVKVTYKDRFVSFGMSDAMAQG
jgi:hypothetical protein